MSAGSSLPEWPTERSGTNGWQINDLRGDQSEPSDGGPHRKYYGINDHGRAMLADQRATWRTFAATLDGLLDERRRPQPVRTIGESR